MVDGTVLAVAGAKGGVGKTTTALNVGAALDGAGFDAVVVELDLAMANLVDFVDLECEPTSDPTFHDVLAGETSLATAMYDPSAGPTVVPSGSTLEGYAETDLDRLSLVTRTLRQAYDFAIFDTPAGASRELLEPVRLADEMVLVSTPRVSAVRNAKNTLELADSVGTEVAGLVLTKSGSGADPGADTIASFLDVRLLGDVPEDPAVPHSQDNGEPVVAYAPESEAATAYRDIAGQFAPSGWLFPPSETDPVDADSDLAERVGRSSSDPTLEDAEPSIDVDEIPDGPRHPDPGRAPAEVPSPDVPESGAPTTSDKTESQSVETSGQTDQTTNSTRTADEEMATPQSLGERLLSYLI